jgi:hypothetical protein
MTEEKAGITIDENIVGIWYVSTLPNQDWMAGLSELEAEKKYKLVYRFRYYKDDKVFESKDTKSWYEGAVTGTRHYCIAAIRMVAKGLDAAGQNKGVYELLNDDGDMKKFWRTFQNAPFAYARMVSK